MFGKDPEKYGYHFGDSFHNWQNKHMNFTEANDHATRLIASTAHKNTLQTFTKMRLHNLGYDAFKTKFSMVDYINMMDDVTMRLQLKKQNYLNRLMAI